jgi:hypothetical protein
MDHDRRAEGSPLLPPSLDNVVCRVLCVCFCVCECVRECESVCECVCSEVRFSLVQVCMCLAISSMRGRTGTYRRRVCPVRGGIPVASPVPGPSRAKRRAGKLAAQPWKLGLGFGMPSHRRDEKYLTAMGYRHVNSTVGYLDADARLMSPAIPRQENVK